MKNKALSRILVVILSVCLLTTVCTSFIGCNDKPNDTGDAVVESITLDTSGVKTVFEWGEAFTAAGLKVTANMSDGTTEDISKKCAISKPDFSSAGQKTVRVMYQGKSATYNVTLNAKVYPKLDAAAAFTVEGENPQAIYTVEGESINTAFTNVAAETDKELIVTTDTAGISGGKYLANYGVVGNYFGFTFSSEHAHDNVTLVMHLANEKDTVLSLGESLNMFLNIDSDDTPLDISMIPTLPVPETEVIDDGGGDPAPAAADGEGTPTEPGVVRTVLWQTRIMRRLSIKEGVNTFSIEVLGNNVPAIDKIEFYVGKVYGTNNRVNITEKNVYVKEFEDFDIEKIKVRQDIYDHWNLKPGQAFIENVVTNVENTSGGKACGATAQGTEVSTIINAAADIKLNIKFVAACVKSVKIKEQWEFYIDGELLTDVEDYDIQKGDPTKSQYWEWYDTDLGTVELSQGEHLFEMKMVGSLAEINIDCVKFKVVGETTLPEGEHECKHVCEHCGKCLDPDCDYTACADKCTTHHCNTVCDVCGKCKDFTCELGDECAIKCDCPHICEHACEVCGKCTSTCGEEECAQKCECPEYDVAVHGFELVAAEADKLDKSGVITRSDFIPSVGAGNYGVGSNNFASGGKWIYGLGCGTEFTAKIYVYKDATVSIGVVAAAGGDYPVNRHMSFKLDGEPVEYTGDGNLNGSVMNWQTVYFVTDKALTAGVHTVTVKFNEGGPNPPDFDCIVVNTSIYDGQDAPHECGHVCVVCNKCLDASCVNSSCAAKCDCEVKYDIAVTEDGSYKFEAEKVKTDGWALQAGKDTFFEGTDKASGGGCLAAFGQAGNKVELNIYLAEDATVEFAAYMAKYEADYKLLNNAYFQIDDGEKIYPDTAFGRAEDGSNDWYNWKKVEIATLNLTKGYHKLVLMVEKSCPNTDYFEFIVSNYNAEQA